MKKTAFFVGLLVVGAVVALVVLSMTPQGSSVVNTLFTFVGGVLAAVWTLVLAALFLLLNWFLGSLFRSRFVSALDKIVEPGKPFTFGQLLLLSAVFGLAGGGIQLLALQAVSRNLELANFLATLGTTGVLLFGPVSALAWFGYGWFAFTVSSLLSRSK